MATRRTFLAGAAAMAVPTVALAGAPAASDAELADIGQEAARLGERYSNLTLKWWGMSVGNSGFEAVADEMRDLHDRLCELADRATLLQATTSEGMRAKAELARHAMIVSHETRGRMELDSDQQLVWSLVCDLTGRA